MQKQCRKNTAQLSGVFSVRFISHNLFYNGATKEGCPVQWILLTLAALLQLGGYYFGQGGQENV